MKKIIVFICITSMLITGSLAFAQENLKSLDEEKEIQEENPEIVTEELIVDDLNLRVPILLYHHISEEVTSNLVVTPEKFEADLLTLKEAGYEAIFLNDLLDYLNGYLELPEKPIIITFDDGYESNYTYAFKAAIKHEMKITIGVIGWSLGRSTFINSDKEIIPHFSMEQAKEMLESGFVDLQNHTYDLHSPQGLSYGYEKPVNLGVLAMDDESDLEYKNRLKEDLMQLNMKLYAETGHISNFIMYPYGAYTEKTEQYISNLGFQGSLAAIDGVRTFRSLKDLKAIPRLTINNEQKGEKLIEMIESNDEVLESQAIEAIIEEENLEALEVLEIDVEKDE